MGFLHFPYSAYYGCKTGILLCSNKTMIRGRLRHSNIVPITILIFYSCLVLHTISATTEVIKDGGFITSENEDFKLGFFSPDKSQLRYLGIWYNKPSVREYIWVANRNNPLSDSSGVLILSNDGNLQVVNGKKDVIWTSNVSQLMPPTSSRKPFLSDSGNLCLNESNTNTTDSGGSNGAIIWQTFRNPTDSIVANMQLRMTNLNMKNALQSWKNLSDPSYGRFTLGTDSLTHPQIIIWDMDQDRPIWRSGPWNGNIFLGLLYTDVSNDYTDTSMRTTDQGEADLVYTGIKKYALSHYKFSYDGVLNEIYWDEGKSKWESVYRAPEDKCDFYNVCGAFASCNSKKSCRCLRGFRPKNAGEWSKGVWSGGCVRHVPLQCGNYQGGKTQEEDGFFGMNKVKGPDLAEWTPGVTAVQCRSTCLANCSCLAYAYDVGAGCMHWSRDLVDIQELSGDGVTLYIRLPKSELGKKQLSKGAIAGLVVMGMVSIAIILCFFWWCKGREKENEVEKNILALENQETPDELSKGHRDDLPMFKYKTLVDATENFHESHKLGKGGFGEVYKGKLKNGQEIAVKRLSVASGQGIKEFTNEVVVISKLQHRNLVRLVGFCTKGEEKMLVYEYMPNKSLDAFLFDSVKREVLNWGKRFNIIQGICRGLIYLHRDSRLRIIHRDLKASNILLDEDLNPKISDFGMAKIFMNNQDEDETKRVVGTYGYMAPEYAMEGQFSEKSDVYSFGVLVLEIITAQKNNTFWFEEDALSLLAYVWKLWAENNVTPIIDPLISDPVFRKDIERCIQVGLLCVQEYAKERPNTTTVLSMLTSEIVDLPPPKKPGMSKRLTTLDTTTASSSSGTATFTITHLSCR